MDILSFNYSNKLEHSSEEALFFLFNENRILIHLIEDNYSPIKQEDWLSLGLTEVTTHYFGSMDTTPCYAVYHSEQFEHERFKWVDMRQVMVESSNDLFAIAGRGKQVLEFKRTHQFCGVCGQRTKESDKELAVHCENCETTVYPRLSPCIIVLVTRGEDLLLARGSRIPEGMFTTLAGFVEAGETLEQCIHREIYEEVRIKVKNTTYYSSQAWPFPHQLMVGFFAEYESGEIEVDGEEIIEAQWWHYTDLPRTPPKGAIAHSLVSDYVQRLQDR
jgi:NAD+ diphosphatase